MSNQIKQIVNLITSFVDRTLLPLIEAKTAENLKVIEQWGKLKAFLSEENNLEIRKVENYIV